MRPLRVLALVALLGLAPGVAGAVDIGRPGSPAFANPAPTVPYPFVQPAPSYCWLSVRVFDTLRYGPIDYCRRKLRFRPGALECYAFTDQVCAVLLPSGQWTETRSAVQRQVLRCPPRPEPPVCRRLDLMGVGAP